MHKLVGLLAVIMSGLLVVMGASAGKRGQDDPNPAAGLVNAAKTLKARGVEAVGQRRRGRAVNLEAVGQHDLGGTGFNADVYSFGNFAYVGVWSGPTCPATGVKVVDISRPSDPDLVSVLQNPDGTSAEDVVVQRVRTPSFRGDLAVTGLQACNRFTSVARGLQFFDVTDPRNPVELGIWQAPFPTIGCHEIDLTVARGGQVLAACANPFANFIATEDEVIVVDASNPMSPQTLGGFGGIPNNEGVGCFPASFAHSVRFFDNGRSLYVSYWDAGTLNLDVSNPASPTLVGTTKIVPPDEDGDNHSMTLARGDRLLLINPEDFSPVDQEADLCAPGDWNGWGELYIYDNSDPSNTQFLGRFATENSASSRTDGFYTVHNTEVFRGNQVVSSWYSDGVRVIDISRPTAPVEIGAFVPPATADPQGFFPTVPLVWGVWPHRGNLILASDINSGLWILRARGGPSR